jgi:hypothetical protein
MPASKSQGRRKSSVAAVPAKGKKKGAAKKGGRRSSVASANISGADLFSQLCEGALSPAAAGESLAERLVSASSESALTSLAAVIVEASGLNVTDDIDDNTDFSSLAVGPALPTSNGCVFRSKKRDVVKMADNLREFFRSIGDSLALLEQADGDEFTTWLLEPLEAMSLSPFKELRHAASVAAYGIGGAQASFFDAIFVHRYRDADAAVRATAIEWLGSWMIDQPEAFLTDDYLKYVGWTLHDKSPVVRHAALTVLVELYCGEEAADFADHLTTFTGRFKGRIVEATSDLDDSCAALALELCKPLLAAGELGTHEDVTAIFSKMSDVSPAVRAAVAPLVSEYYLATVNESMEANSDQPLEQLKLRALLEFVDEFTLQPENPAYVVDALRGVDPLVSDFGAMIDLLRESDELDDGEVLALARIVSAAAAPSAVPTKDSAATDAADSVLADFTQVALPALPELVSRFAGDPDVLAEVLGFFALCDMDKALVNSSIAGGALAESLASVVVDATGALILDAAGAGFAALLAQGSVYRADAEPVFRQLATTLSDSLTSESHDDDAAAALARVAATLTHVAFPPTVLEAVGVAATRVLDVSTAREAALVGATKVAGLSLMWRLRSAVDGLVRREDADEEAPSATELDEELLSLLVTVRDSLLATLDSLLATTTSHALEEAIVSSMSDVCCAFARLDGTAAGPIVAASPSLTGPMRTHLLAAVESIRLRGLSVSPDAEGDTYAAALQSLETAMLSTARLALAGALRYEEDGGASLMTCLGTTAPQFKLLDEAAKAFFGRVRAERVDAGDVGGECHLLHQALVNKFTVEEDARMAEQAERQRRGAGRKKKRAGADSLSSVDDPASTSNLDEALVAADQWLVMSPLSLAKLAARFITLYGVGATLSASPAQQGLARLVLCAVRWAVAEPGEDEMVRGDRMRLLAEATTPIAAKLTPRVAAAVLAKVKVAVEEQFLVPEEDESLSPLLSLVAELGSRAGEAVSFTPSSVESRGSRLSERRKRKSEGSTPTTARLEREREREREGEGEGEGEGSSLSARDLDAFVTTEAVGAFADETPEPKRRRSGRSSVASSARTPEGTDSLMGSDEE